MSEKMCDALHYLFDNIFIKFYRQIVGIQMGTNSGPLVVDLFLFCYEETFSYLCQRIMKLIL